MALSAFSALSTSLSDSTVNAGTYLLIQVSLLSPISAGGLFSLSIGLNDLLLNTGAACQVASNAVITDAFIDYTANACSISPGSLHGVEYYSTVSLATVCTSICPTGSKFIIRLKGQNNYYSKTHSSTLTLRSKSSSSLGISEQAVQLSTIPALSPNTLDTVTLTRSSATLNTPVSIVLSFTPSLTLLQASSLLLTLPLSKTVFASGKAPADIKCTLSKPSVVSDLTCSATVDTYNIYVTVPVSFCKSGNTVINCAAGQEISITLGSSILANPAQVLNTANNANYKPVELISYYQSVGQVAMKSIQPLDMTPSLNIP